MGDEFVGFLLITAAIILVASDFWSPPAEG